MSDLVAELRQEAESWKAVAESYENDRLEQKAEIERLNAKVIAATMAKTRLDHFADDANAGAVHYSARELKRKIGAAFADFDAVQQKAGETK